MILLSTDLSFITDVWYVWVAGCCTIFPIYVWYALKKERLDKEHFDFMKRERAWPMYSITETYNQLQSFVRNLEFRIKEAGRITKPDELEASIIDEFLKENKSYKDKYDPGLRRLFQVISYLRLRIVIMEQGLWDEFWEWYKDKHNLRIIVLLISTVSIIALCAFCLRPSLSCRTSPPLWGEAAHERGGTQSEGRY